MACFISTTILQNPGKYVSNRRQQSYYITKCTKITRQNIKKTTFIKNQELLQKSPLSQIAPSLNVPRIFFYPAEADQEHGHVNINEERSKQLPQSLSEVLTLFYPLAGRHIKDDASIHCNDKGAEYLEVHVNRASLSFLRE
ncbi:hypothetical protein NC652_019812 [Populus alba x Populus x berolinensis]|uniref:Uncharacterized protein n=1 Tax=Populus alba x Populus x berolinensis TaxID=444605 RepID=A0AAD6VXM9_9ROSI|nr:hypothetical protein NC652_019812 [Populus alba x Populus x berolinensis]KAJ6991575.1 hypothetical protein NC653_019675 [Populus alba x Populus x berolinensis]